MKSRPNHSRSTPSRNSKQRRVSSGRGSQRSRKRAARPGFAQLKSEQLESRALLAIDTWIGNAVSNYLIVTSGPDPLTPNAAADDVFVTRTAPFPGGTDGGGLMIAGNSSFSPQVLPGRFASPDLLYVTNGIATGVSNLSPGDSRSTPNGPGKDAVLSRTTTYILKHGSIDPPTYALAVRGVDGVLDYRRVPLAQPPVYDNARDAFDYEINGAINGSISYGGNSWDFAIAPDSNMYFRQTQGSPLGPQPISGTYYPGDQQVYATDDPTGRGRGERGSLSITWSESVATVPHTVVGESQPPVVAQVNYFADYGTSQTSPYFDVHSYRVSEQNIAPSASATPSFRFDVGEGIINGSLTGTIYVDTIRIGDGAPVEGISFRFSTDSIVGNSLYFYSEDEQRFTELFGTNDWLRVSGTYLGGGEIDLRFENAYNGDGGFTEPGKGNLVLPGPVTLTSASFLQYVTPEKPNDFTLFAGHDLASQLWVDLRASGSTINIDSRVIASPVIDTRDVDPLHGVPDVDLRATNVNLNAQVSSTDDLFIGDSRSGAVAELVTLNASVIVPRDAKIYVEDDPNTLPESADLPGPTHGQLLVSQSGSLAASFFVTPPPFGNSGVAPVATEAEPNNSTAQANDLRGSFLQVGNNVYQATVTGTISAGNDGDLDYYKVTLRPNDVFEISLVGDKLSDPFVRLLSSSGGQIASDDDSGAGLNSFLRYVNGNQEQDVYVVADSFGSSTGSYSLKLTVRGAAATPTERIFVTAVSSDVLIEGSIYGVNQSYLMRSLEGDKEKAPFELSTRSRRTGADVGQIRGGTAQVILANDAETPLDVAEANIAYNTVDLKTALDSLRVRASVRQNGVETSAFGPFPYDLSIREEDAITIDAVAASTRTISIASDGIMTWTAALSTFGDLDIRTENISGALSAFVSTAPISTAKGTISIAASDISVGSTLQVLPQDPDEPVDPTRTDISLMADNGSVNLTGLVESPNRISIGQATPGAKAGRVSGVGRVKTRDLAINAITVGNPDGSPLASGFYLRTDVDSLSVDAQSGVAIDELNDIAITRLTSPSGLVALRAAGTDRRVGSPNDLALTASLIDVVNLFVSAPNGSIDVRDDTAKRLLLGMPVALQQGQVESMKAAGSVTILSTAGGIDVLDAPFAGSGARRVDAATVDTLPGTYNAGVSGQTAGTITAAASGLLNSLRVSGGALDAVNRVLRVGDRVLVKNGTTNKPGELDSGADSEANGVYVVTDLGSAAKPWKLTRASDTDTFGELPTNTVVYNRDKAELFNLTHTMADASGFGGGAITVESAEDGFEPVTVIGSTLVVPENDVQFIVSSSGGTNLDAGSLGKMIELRQRNQLLDPDQVQGFKFSSLLTSPIVLQQELPRLTTAFAIDGAVASRFTPAGYTAANQPVILNGQQITQTQLGSRLYRGTVSATIAKASPAVLTLSTFFTESAELHPGMAVSGIGIKPGTAIKTVDSSVPGKTKVTLDQPVEGILYNRKTNQAVISVTFATEINGLNFVEGSAGGSVSNIYVGGFESGAAIKVEVPGIRIENVTTGTDSSLTQRLGNQVGVQVSTGKVDIIGGRFVSSSVAGIRTTGDAAISVVGATVGDEKLPNVEGISIAGTGGATIGLAGKSTFVQYNRTGVVLKAGTNVMVNTTVAHNSFDGVSIEGGSNTIGDSVKVPIGANRNTIYANTGWGLRIAGAPLALLQKVFGNVFGTVSKARPTKDDNGKGNITTNGSVVGVAPFVPSLTTGLDGNGNQHGLNGFVVPNPGNPTGTVAKVRFPWRRR